MEPTTTIIILSFACLIAASMAIYFGIRKLQLQRKINAINKNINAYIFKLVFLSLLNKDISIDIPMIIGKK